LRPSPIDRMTAHLRSVQPELMSVTSSAELRVWAQALLDSVDSGTATGLARTAGAGEWAPYVDDRGIPQPSPSLRTWESRFTDVLERLARRGELPRGADTLTQGAAFAALIYGGFLLDQTSHSASSLRTALGMAMSQVLGANWPGSCGDS
jgi:hypothetical protein